MYRVMSPSAGKQFTGTWNPTISLFNIVQWAVNQTTPTSVFYGYQREGSTRRSWLSRTSARTR